VSATIATPGTSPCRFVVPSITNAWVTPGSARISSRFALATFAPKTGAFSYTACFIPGTVTSMPKSGCPVTIFLLSTPGIDFPMILKSLAALSGTVAGSGTGRAAARVASSPYVRRRRDAWWCTAPSAVVSSAAGTFSACAAAPISSCRPTAPARRSGSQFIGVAVLPPAN